MTNKDITVRLSLKDGEAVRRGLAKLGDDGQAALAKIEKQSDPASKGLLSVSAVSQELQENVNDLADSLGSAGTALRALGPAGVAVAAGIALAVVSITGLVRASVDAARELGAIKDEAEQAGTAVETYQALQYAAEQYSVSQSALTDGLKELNLRADEWIRTGSGPAAESFKRLGFTQKELQGQLGDTGKMFLEVVSRMKGLESQAARLRVADEIFGGTGGEQFVRMINAGNEAISGMMKQARDLGYVIDGALIDRADEARDKLDQLQKLIDIQLNSALVDLAPVASTVADAFASLARFVADTVDAFRDIDAVSLRGLENRANEADAAFQQKIEALRAAEAELAQAQSNELPFGFGDSDILNAETKVRNLRKEAKAAQEQLMALQAELARRNSTEQVSAPTVSVGTSDDQKQADKIKAVTDALKFQLDQLNRTAYGREVYLQLQRAGIEGGTKEAHQIADLVLKLREQQQAEKDATDARRDGAQMTKSVMTAEEKRAKALDEVNRLLNAGVIAEETARRKRAEITREYEEDQRRRLDASREWTDGAIRGFRDYSESATDAAANTQDLVEGGFGALENSLTGIATHTKTASQAVTEMVTSMLADFARLMIRQNITGPLAQSVGGYFSSLFGGSTAAMASSSTTFGNSYTAGIYHDGGQIGTGTQSRQVDLSLFDDAPRLHGGGSVALAHNEKPIIALDNERVLTQAQQQNTAQSLMALANIASAKDQPLSVKLNVNNNAGRVAEASATARKDGSGGLTIDVFVEEIEGRMSNNIARGKGLADVIENRYGLDPAAGARR